MDLGLGVNLIDISDTQHHLFVYTKIVMLIFVNIIFYIQALFLSRFQIVPTTKPILVEKKIELSILFKKIKKKTLVRAIVEFLLLNQIIILIT
jgi:hypothetical protein